MEQVRRALERGEDESDEGVDDVWADAASKAEVIRLEGELDTLRRRITRVEVVVREIAVKAVANNVRLAPAARNCATKEFHDTIRKHGATLTNHTEVISLKAGPRFVDLEMKSMHEPKEK